MADINVSKYNEVFVRIRTTPAIEMEISEEFTFFADGYKFAPKYKAKIWDGKLRLYNRGTKLLPLGLTAKLIEFAQARNYSIHVDKGIIRSKAIYTLEETERVLQKLELHIQTDKSPEPQLANFRDYQIEAINHVMNRERAVLLSATSSGKSAIIYAIIRLYSQALKGKSLLVVPSTHLVTQMYGDFATYAYDTEYNVEAECTKVYADSKYDPSKRCVISTWQSMMRQPKEFFTQFSAVILDECHQGKAKEIKTILENCVNARIRVGTTGTLDDVAVNELTLTGYIGPTHKVITSRELMDRGESAMLKLKCIVLKYPDDVRKTMARKKYPDEMDFLVSNEKRNNFIADFALSKKNNTVILVNLVEKHGKPLYELLKDISKGTDKNIYFIYGGKDTEEREEIRQILEKESDCILIATYGTYSTGVSVRNLHNIILASPSRSKIRVLQSAGRGGRLHSTKQFLRFYDLVDDLEWKTWKNHTLDQFGDRLKYYIQENFDYEIINVNI